MGAGAAYVIARRASVPLPVCKSLQVAGAHQWLWHRAVVSQTASLADPLFDVNYSLLLLSK